jgi:hypothetical protein
MSGRLPHACARARRINALILDGATPDEIAAELGVSVWALAKLKQRWGFPLSQRRGSRRLCVWIADRHVKAIDRLAAHHKADRMKALADLVGGILSDDPNEARRTWARVRRIISESATS